MKILVTGGLGYIGSHVSVDLIKQNHDIIIIDNLSNSTLSVLNQIESITKIKPNFQKIDLLNKIDLKSFFNKHNDIDGIIHFAALKSVSQSTIEPLSYYENNILGIINVLDLMPKGIPFVFSSSCTVYGSSDKQPMNELLPFGIPESPYGHTKQICEKVIQEEYNTVSNFKAISLRYFNPIGAHESGLIGENPTNIPENIMPYLTQTVNGEREVLTVFGDDYPTNDGSCIRDYIHIMDLSNAHIKAIEYLVNTKSKKFLEAINIGTGNGVSVFELISSFEKTTGQKVPFKIGKRRPGDVVISYADTKKALKLLKWKSKYSLSDALSSAWNWEQNK